MSEAPMDIERDELQQAWLDLEQAMGCLSFLIEVQHRSDAVTQACAGAERLVRSARDRLANAALRAELCT
jgi:hypothetical protein